jgi:predicted N-acetyltransferase YhbS
MFSSMVGGRPMRTSCQQPSWLPSVRSTRSSAQQLLQNLPTSSAVFVAEYQGSIVGVVLVRETRESSNTFAAQLDAIYVLPGMQRRKVGSGLLEDAVSSRESA